MLRILFEDHNAAVHVVRWPTVKNNLYNRFYFFYISFTNLPGCLFFFKYLNECVSTANIPNAGYT